MKLPWKGKDGGISTSEAKGKFPSLEEMHEWWPWSTRWHVIPQPSWQPGCRSGENRWLGWLDGSKVGELAGGCGRRTEGEDSRVLAKRVVESGLHGGGNGAQKEKGE